MQDLPVLAQVTLGYSPMIDRQRHVVATRLTVFPEAGGATPDAGALLRAIAEVWPSEAAAEPLRLVAPRPMAAARVAAPATPPAVSLNFAGEALLRAVMGAEPGPQRRLEVPAFMAGDAALAPLLRHLRDAGTQLLLKGRPLVPLAAEVAALFSHTLVEAGEAAARDGTAIHTGARSSAAIEAAFQAGAAAVMGWPWEDPAPPARGRSTVPSDIQVVMELINGVDRDEPVSKLEAVLRRDPTLAFRLLRYLNSPAFGLSVEINSFGHALMMLGHQRLKRWLALLLVSSAKGNHARPVMFGAVRRGLLMEELVRGQDGGGDAETRGEMFICGVFSLLDRLLQQPIAELLGSVPVPERVQLALRGEGGPYQPFLDLVRAIEQESVFDIREQSEALLLGPAAVNRAVLSALRAAQQLDH
jgi:EAL and modified HD-GYP domain-containing signal transduction protein